MTGYIEAQGGLLKIKCDTQQSTQKHGGGQRGAVQQFTRASRKRMIEFMARLKTGGVRATFLTLTFSGNPTPKQAKIALKRFVMRLRRKYENASGVWRMEFQDRGSPHFHVLLFNLAFIPQRELQLVWEACTGEEKSILDIRLCHSRRKITNYISKYMAKALVSVENTSLEDDAYQHDSPVDSPGRFWGYIQKAYLPLGQKFTDTLESREVYSYLRWWVRKMSRGRGSKAHSAATLFSDDAVEMFFSAMRREADFRADIPTVILPAW